LAIKIYKEILACSPGKMTVVGAIEDGTFEESIQPSVSIFAETIWNPKKTKGKILESAMSPYYNNKTGL
jgi:hypothetical protein